MRPIKFAVGDKRAIERKGRVFWWAWLRERFIQRKKTPFVLLLRLIWCAPLPAVLFHALSA